MRYLALDTETTGLKKNDRIIEIAVVELMSGSINSGTNTKEKPTVFHHYVNPGPGIKVDPGAFNVHRISDEFLVDKPIFADIAKDFVEFIRDAVLIIHNAPFDLYYMNFELALCHQRSGHQRSSSQSNGDTEYNNVESICSKVEDTLRIAKNKFPGQSNSLDALLARFGIDASSRDKGHGALVDTKLLCKVYENLCLNQSNLGLESGKTHNNQDPVGNIQDLGGFHITKPTAEELEADERIMSKLRQGSAKR
ncbi:MAG: DNA polymerase III subunit epsilon [Candidatus Portiera sp.]|nr:DNA polymerase III subunit epsilon [Portiera sp.]